MRVFNLTMKDLDYRGRKIPPNGGSLEYGELSFIPDRDLALSRGSNPVISFGSLPPGWMPQVTQTNSAPLRVALKELVEQAIVEERPNVAETAEPEPPSKKDWKKK